ncbi:MAG: hypothetical protein JSV16_16040, partial [Candidatus Hydrogenedentota bacterium]
MKKAEDGTRSRFPYIPFGYFLSLFKELFRALDELVEAAFKFCAEAIERCVIGIRRDVDWVSQNENQVV